LRVLLNLEEVYKMNKNNNLGARCRFYESKSRVLGVQQPKKGQEEMVGFILIIVLVAVIGVVFLSISLRQPSSEVIDGSENIASLLNSLNQITSVCENPQSNFLDVSDLISGCFENKLCLGCTAEECGSSKSACETLENTLKNAMETSYNVGEESSTRYYKLIVYDSFDNSPIIAPIIEGPSESCPGRKLFNERTIGDRVMSLEVCFSG
jgi:hypothetical protein